MKIAIFGCGDIYNRYKSLLPKDVIVVVILDNDITDHGKMHDGVMRVYPREIFLYDIDLIILMSDAAVEMREQLYRIGVEMSKVVHYKDYFGRLEQKKELFLVNEKQDCKSKSLLIISNVLGFHGAPITVLGMVLNARKMGYCVSVAAPGGDQAFIDELNLAGASVILQDGIEHASEDALKWTNKYDKVIVNSIPMISCALKISANRRTILWLHDSPEAYYSLKFWWDVIQKGLEGKNLKIIAVSKRAIENFRRFFYYTNEIGILTPYLQDWYLHETPAKNDCMVFAIIAPIVENKGQHILLEAIHYLKSYGNIKFIFVGRSNKSTYSKEILEEISQENCCEFLGEKTRKEMGRLYQTVDAVIVPSKEETLSLAAVEAMMMKKVCIVSDHCGIAEYIKNGENGFVFPIHDVKALADTIEWCIDNKEKCVEIGDNARKIYEESFSLSGFKNSFNEVLN